MAAPPSRKSWVWQVAAAAAERMQQVGSEVDDLLINVERTDGALRVTVGDFRLGGRRRPAEMAAATIPGDGDADALVGEIRACIELELKRLRSPAPITETMWQQLRQELAGPVRAHVRPEELRVHAYVEDGRTWVAAGDAEGDVIARPLSGIPHLKMAQQAAQRLRRELLAAMTAAA